MKSTDQSENKIIGTTALPNGSMRLIYARIPSLGLGHQPIYCMRKAVNRTQRLSDTGFNIARKYLIGSTLEPNIEQTHFSC